MADERFLQAQRRCRNATHVRVVNTLVDELCDPHGRGFVPAVAPWHGGVEARVLSALRDPGPKTLTAGGSGFLCIENDDPSAQRQAEMFAAVGISPADVTPWNAYPWYINRAPKAAELQAGVEPMRRLVDLKPRLRVVLLQGVHAQDGWRRLEKKYPGLVAERRRHPDVPPEPEGAVVA